MNLRNIFTFFLTLFSLFSSAQMDTEHWFAPMFSNYTSAANYQAVYLSTSETTPFPVKIYSGNSLIGTVSLSKGAPQIFEIPRQYIITEAVNEVSTIQQKGLHLVGDKKYFATLRFSVHNHAEIVTSKGKAALGQEFFIGMPRLNATVSSNYTANILAVENGTTVTLSGYRSGLIFTNDSTISSTKTVTLNSGESYIFDVDEGTNPALDGLIGAKITADKPISVSNGSFSGRMAETGVDIFMDQSVPVEKTGKEFIIMGGNGRFPDSDIESTLIIATKDNTDVYLNNETTKYANIPKAGGYIFVPSEKYQDLDGANNIYALYVKSTDNVYVYGILAGSRDQEMPSGGMNLIPALSCFLPSKIDELSEVNRLPLTYSGPQSSVRSEEYHNVKLNILAQKGASVNVNGSTSGLLGPFKVAGSADWEVFTLSGASGNQTIETTDDKAITAGIAGGSGPAGFGGYFAGFSSIPSISKIGDCARGQMLEVDDFYNEYKWEYSTDQTNWTILPDTGYQINPGKNFGYYRVTVTKLSCLPAQTTKNFKYLKCPTYSNSEFTIGACNTIKIDPIFTKNPTWKADPTKTAIILKPSSGKAYVGADGRIYFEAENTTDEQVKFTYYLEQEGTEFPEYEEITVTVNIFQIKPKNTEITECIDYGGKGYFNLKKSFEPANVHSNYTGFEYYTDAAFSPQSRIPDSEISNYYSAPGKTVYVKISDIYSCDNRLNPGKIQLKTYELPQVKSIDVKGETSATIEIEKGRMPYSIAVKKGKHTQNDLLPDSAYQLFDTDRANIEINGGKGFYTVFIKSADNCLPVIGYFTVIAVNNVLTPNGDGYNDSLEVPELNNKINPVFKIYDRYGKKVFEGNTLNNFTWTGKAGGFNLPTGTYWYYMTWQDYDGAENDSLQGWILLKNY